MTQSMINGPQLVMEQLNMATAPTDNVGLRSDVLKIAGERGGEMRERGGGGSE